MLRLTLTLRLHSHLPHTHTYLLNCLLQVVQQGSAKLPAGKWRPAGEQVSSSVPPLCFFPASRDTFSWYCEALQYVSARLSLYGTKAITLRNHSVMKNWRPDRFQRLRTFLQCPIFVDKASAPAEFINSPTIGLALNGMDVDHTSASWKLRPDAATTLGEDNSNLY